MNILFLINIIENSTSKKFICTTTLNKQISITFMKVFKLVFYNFQSGNHWSEYHTLYNISIYNNNSIN